MNPKFIAEVKVSSPKSLQRKIPRQIYNICIAQGHVHVSSHLNIITLHTLNANNATFNWWKANIEAETALRLYQYK